jgi:hypothetical protein
LKEPAPRLKGLWKTIVVEGRHGLGRVSCLWRLLTAVERDGGKMGRMDVYRGGETARRSERTALLGLGVVEEKRERDETGEGRDITLD